ncbi:trimethylamine methyltransferase family protein [Desulfitibacter alkalitolerans]|uniref:trimethylamine methyltransferase family protein n=1 Tax=Desulfitibacter alkalitolerans TaxID=264641 RepID=UPI000484B7A0|nr:trimethylamine methyltransferase family protein [Desulfitibacter alkalitolerans]
MLSTECLEQIHQASLTIISEIGIKVEDEAFRNTLQNWGCEVKGCRVHFPILLIEQMLKNLEKEIRLSNGEKEIILDKGKTYSHATGGMPNIVDHNTGNHRLAVSDDLIKAIHLMNELKHVDLPCASYYLEDIPGQVNQIKQFEYMLRYTNKPFYGPGVSSPEEAKYIAELFNVFIEFQGLKAKEAYPCVVGISPESPLYYPKQITDTMRIIINTGIPTVMLIAPIVGISAPMTMAGALAQMNASMLAFATMSYMINPQTPVIYGARLSFANMKNGVSIWGLPEVGVASAGAVQLAKKYGFISDVYGFSCSACDNDLQSGYEKAINALLPALAGANLLSGMGSLASLTLGSYTQLVVDDEIFAMIKKAIKGFLVNEDTLALNIVADAAREGNYLAQEHTVRHLRNGEVFIPTLGFDRLLTDWIRDNKPTIDEKARQRVEDLLAKTPEVESLPVEIDQEIKNILNASYKELVLKT